KCVGCMQQKAKKELVRVVKNAEGEISMDLTGKKSGRGAYICPNKECLQKARKAKRLERNFECQIPDEVFERLETEIETRTIEN
ncbi:MAG: YlxR family protein, partial [Oscillospiraceae bacterium]